ncbi:MAG: amidohydrolase [Actinobacteria bacterium]|nr:MAG: amidohydrolase [Actinomycetota bacterium]
MRIDTQAHVVTADHDTYPLNPPDIDPMGTARSRWFDAPALTAEDLLQRMDDTGIDRAVVVQAFSSYQYDNSYTADAAAANPDRLASSCIIDVEHDAINMVRHWIGERGARAIRLFLRNAAPDWLLQPGSDKVFNEIGRLGAIAQVVGLDADLPRLLQAATRHPEIPFLLDHCGMPDLSGGSSYPNATNLFALSDAPNISVKLSTHVFTHAKQGGSSATEIAHRLVNTFGASRVMWASDYSVLGLVYADCVAEAQQACSDLPPGDRDLVLGDAANAMWWPS